jgi:hypothetical protein
MQAITTGEATGSQDLLGWLSRLTINGVPVAAGPLFPPFEGPRTLAEQLAFERDHALVHSYTVDAGRGTSTPVLTGAIVVR